MNQEIYKDLENCPSDLLQIFIENLKEEQNILPLVNELVRRDLAIGYRYMAELYLEGYEDYGLYQNTKKAEEYHTKAEALEPSDEPKLKIPKQPWWRNYFVIKADADTLKKLDDDLQDAFLNYGTPDNTQCMNVPLTDLLRPWVGETTYEGDLLNFWIEENRIVYQIDCPDETFHAVACALKQHYKHVEVTELPDDEVMNYYIEHYIN